MQLFILSMLSYWLGALVHCRIYRKRLLSLTRAHRALLDNVYGRDEDPEWLAFCSDDKVLEVYANAPPESREFRICEATVRQRGLAQPQPLPPFRSVKDM